RREQSMRFLAAATATLASSSDHRAALQRVAQLAVRTVADWCMVDLREADGSFRRIAVAHANPAHAQLAQMILALHAHALREPNPVSDIVRTGERKQLSQITDVLLREQSRDE